MLLLILLSNRLVKMLKEAASGDIPAESIFPLLGLSAVNALVVLVPMAAFLAVLLTVGRMYRENEIVTLSGCGISHWQISKILSIFALLAALFMVWISLYVTPITSLAASMLQDEAERASDIAGLVPGRFKEVSGGKRVVYVESIDRKRQIISNIFIYSRNQDVPWLMTARTAYQHIESGSGDTLVFMENGYRYRGEPADENFQVTSFKRHWVRMREREPVADRSKRRGKSTLELWRSDKRADIAELQWRLSAPLATALFVFLGLPLGKLQPGEGRFGKLISGVLVYIIYFKLLGVARVGLGHGSIPTWIGLWWVHAGLASYLFLMMWWQNSPPGRFLRIRR